MHGGSVDQEGAIQRKDFRRLGPSKRPEYRWRETEKVKLQLSYKSVVVIHLWNSLAGVSTMGSELHSTFQCFRSKFLIASVIDSTLSPSLQISTPGSFQRSYGKSRTPSAHVATAAAALTVNCSICTLGNTFAVICPCAMV